jgi:hypothetical protein
LKVIKAIIITKGKGASEESRALRDSNCTGKYFSMSRKTYKDASL